ncbi:MAG: IS21 family transposase [Thermodesulfovibrionales bacterium]
MYKWQQVKALRTQGLSIKKISRQLKMSRNTVRKYLRSSEPPCFKARHYDRQLDEYEGYIEEMFDKDYIGTRIYNELLQSGYKGSLSTVHRHIAKLKEDKEIKAKATSRVETAPGKQMQYDWKEWNLPVGGKTVKVYIHEVVLSYSRKKYYISSLTITTQDVIRAISRAIEYFGGFAEEIVIDNPRQMVITHRKDGTVCYNDEFLRFCGLYGIQPNPCSNYRARTKGKAERPFYYLQEHLLRGLEVKDIAEFDILLSGFTDKYNGRLHTSLKETPDERFRREKSYLRNIPGVEPATLSSMEVRTVSNDGYISWDGALYPVPMRYCLRQVKVEAEFGKIIKVYDMAGDLIQEHKVRLIDKSIRPQHPEHEDMNRAYMERKEAHRAKSIIEFIDSFGETAEVYIEGLRAAVTANIYWHIEEIMRYTMLYSTEDIKTVLKECIEIGAYHKNSVRRLLESKQPLIQPIELLKETHVISTVDIKRPLSDYRVPACADREVSL